jgi:PKD domain
MMGTSGAQRIASTARARSRVLRGGILTALVLVALCASAHTASAILLQLKGGARISYQRAPGARVLGAPASSQPFDAAFSNLDYNGGQVMPSNTNYAVYWAPPGAPAYPAGYQSGINRYFEDLAHDSGGHENVDSVSGQYNDSGGNFASYNSHFGGAFVDEDPYPANGCTHAPKCLTDEQIRAELVKFAAAHHLATDLSHEYFLLTPEGVESCMPAEGEGLPPELCSDNVTDGEFAYYCAYHGSIPIEGSGPLVYSNDPFVNGKNCDEANHPNGTSDSALIGGLSHEHVESLTDPEPNNAWTDFATGAATGYEIGDKCRTFNPTTEYGTALGTAENGATYNQVVNGHFYWYQQEWSNLSNECLQRVTLPDAQPSATFTSEPLAGTEMKFDATGSPAGAGFQYSWQFNDSGHAPNRPTETSSLTISHKFPASGKFVVALTPFNGSRKSAGTATARTIVVGDEGPSAAFSVATASPQTGKAVEFDGSAAADPDGPIASYSWNFGDGSAAGGEKPSHTYASRGKFTVTLTITDASGQTASASHTVSVGKVSQVIQFTSSPPSNATVGGATYAVTASASSGLPVTFSSGAPSVCSVSGSTVSFVGPGICTIDANQAGSSEYEPAPQLQQSFTVGKGSQTITFTSSAPANASVGGPSYEVAATGGASGNPVTFAIDPASGSVCSLSGAATVAFKAGGTCTIDANQAGSANYNAAPQAQQSFNVSKRSQAIAFTSHPPTNASVGGPTYEVAATGGASGNPVTFTVDPASGGVCSVFATTVSFTGAGTCTIDANQAGNSEYEAAPQAQQSITVGKVSQVIKFTSSPPSNAAVGGPAYTVAATATSGLAVSFSSETPAVCSLSGSSVSFNASGTCTLDANQSGNAIYSAAPQAQQGFAVAARASLQTEILLPLGPVFPPAPNSDFTSVPAHVNQRTGAVAFAVSVADPGTLGWVLTFPNGKFGAFSARAAKCKAAFVRLGGKCRPARIVFARGFETVAQPGSVSFTALPTSSAAKALKSALARKRALPVAVKLTFQSALGGAPVSHTLTLLVRVRR